MAAQYSFDRSRLVYELSVRQEPKQARMCGVGGKADRRPIDPPPIVQLKVIDPSLQSGNPVVSSSNSRRDDNAGSDSGDEVLDLSSYTQSFLQNPYYFMFACLARPDDDGELHFLKDGRTRSTTGSVVSSLYHLKDPQNNNQDVGFFVFPDLSVRTEGSYRLKLSLFEVVSNNVHHCKSIYSAPFYVYTAKKFPGMEESTPLSCSLADQGIKIRIRKDIRVRKRQIPALTQPISIEGDGDSDGEDRGDQDCQPKRAKRSRIDSSADASGSGLAGAVQTQLPWPAAPIDSLGTIIPPPPAVPPKQMPSSSSGVIIPPPPKPGREQRPANGIAMGVHVPPGGTLPGPSVFDGRGGGIIQMDPPQPQPTSPNQQNSPQSSDSTTQFRDASQTDVTISSPQLSTSSQQSHPPYPTRSSPVSAAPAAPQQQQEQQALQPQHQSSNSLANANGPPQPVTHPSSAQGPPPTMQHQPQHPQHMQHPQANSYSPHPYSQWGPSAPINAPAQPAVYDPYYHHQQHYAAYAPLQPPPPPPGRYDYAMYTHTRVPPPAMSSYGYYDQHQPHHAHPQQQMIPHPHHYPQHQVQPPPMHQYAPPPTAGIPASNNAPSSAGTPPAIVTDTAQLSNGSNGSTPTQPPPNFASNSGGAITTAQPTPVAQYSHDYGVVYNNRPVESAPSRGGYGAPSPAPTPAQYGMTPLPPAPMAAPAPPPHAAHYPMHNGGAPPHPSVTPMRYGPPPHHPHAPHPHSPYSYTTYAAPPEWAPQGFVTNHQHSWDAYSHHAQQQQQQQHHQQQQQQQQQHSHQHVSVAQPQPHTSAVMVATGAVDPNQGHNHAHRIQLAPIPSEHNGTNGNNGANGNHHPHHHQPHHHHHHTSSNNSVSPSIQHTSPVRSANNVNSPSMRNNGNSNGRVTTTAATTTTMPGDSVERVDDGVHGYHHGHGGQVQGKKNPLSIGSIISNDAR